MRQTARLVILTSLLVVIAAAPAARAEDGRPTTLRVYHVGNSLTDTVRYAGLQAMAESRGHTHVWGRHMIPGAGLQWIWQHPEHGFREDPFGYYGTGLSGFEWDALTLQPHSRLIEGEEGDLINAGNFIELALRRSPGADIYIFSIWPPRDEDEERSTEEAPVHLPLDFAAKWTRRYTGEWDGTWATREYFERLTAALRERYPEASIHMIPVGDVLFELDRRMEAGQVPGYEDVEQLYADGIHFNDMGAFVVAAAFYATLYREDPTSMAVPDEYGLIHDATARVVQQTVWDVVSRHGLAGVNEGDGQ